MNDTLFRRNVIAKCKGALDRALALGNEGHAGLRGTLREILMSELLEPLLPPEAKLGTGQLVAQDGTLSPQIDVLIYARSIMPPSLFNESTGFFPIESCLYTIEVKSRLTGADLKSTIANARLTLSMPMVPSGQWTVDLLDNSRLRYTSMATPPPINSIFAFGSDLTGDPLNELQRYRNFDPKSEIDPAIRVICIYRRGYWYFTNDGWMYAKNSDNLNEIMLFLTGTVNTFPELLARKGRPKFGLYLAPSGDHLYKCAAEIE